MKEQSAFTLLELTVVIGIIALMSGLVFVDFSKMRYQSEWKNSLEWFEATLNKQALLAQSYHKIEGNLHCYGVQWTVEESFQEFVSLYNQGACQSEKVVQDSFASPVGLSGKSQGQNIDFVYAPGAKNLQVMEEGVPLGETFSYEWLYQDYRRTFSPKTRLPYFEWKDSLSTQES